MEKKLNCIVLVDDDADDNYFHKMIIDEMGVTEHLEVTCSGFEAIDFLKKKNQPSPELIFLDINMPKMSGWEFLEEHSKLKEEQKAKVIVIMLSSTKNPEDVKRAAGFSETIEFNYKPLTEKALFKIFEDYFPENGIVPLLL